MQTRLSLLQGMGSTLENKERISENLDLQKHFELAVALLQQDILKSKDQLAALQNRFQKPITKESWGSLIDNLNDVIHSIDCIAEFVRQLKDIYKTIELENALRRN